jgi:hypothetical protein
LNDHSPTAPLTFTVTHSDASVTAVYERWWTRRYASSRRMMLVIIAVASGYMYYRQEMNWFGVMILTLACAYAFFLEQVRATAIKLARQHYGLLAGSPLHYQLDEETLCEESSLGRFAIHWRAFAGVEDLEGYTLLLRKPIEAQQFLAFPRDQLPSEVAAFLRERVARANAAV